MESITIKVEDSLAKEIEKVLSPYYSTKTEFIREAIREKLKSLKKEETMEILKNYFGRSKVSTSPEEDRKIREQAGKCLAEKFSIALD